jgi:hypothetical protein
MTGIKWVLVTSPSETGRAQINIATLDGNQVALNLTGGAAADIACMLIDEIYGQDGEQDERIVH